MLVSTSFIHISLVVSYYNGTKKGISPMPHDMDHTTTLEHHSSIESVKSDLMRSLTTLDTLGLDHAAIYVDQALWSLMSKDEKKVATAQANTSFEEVLDKRVLTTV